MVILCVEDLSKRFVGLMALSEVSFTIEDGSIQAIIGPNGAGKTTLFQIVSGVLRPSTGSIFYRDTEITRQAPHAICALGIARTFQMIRLFPNMTVLENVMTGLHTHLQTGVFMSGFHLPAERREETKARKKALEILDFIGIVDKADLLSTSLPYGQQRRVEIVRAMAARPQLLLLDEPAAGMNPQEITALMDFIRWIKMQGSHFIRD